MLPTILYIYKEALSALQNNKVFTYLCACLISSSLPPGKLLGALPRMLNIIQSIKGFLGHFKSVDADLLLLLSSVSKIQIP